MEDSKDPKMFALEKSLISFLCRRKGIEEKVPGGERRIRSLSAFLDFRDDKHPCFTVQIGIFECSFNILTGFKERGTCFGLERYIVDWLQQPSVLNEFKLMMHQSEKTEE